MLQWQIFLNKINFDKVVFGDKDRKLFVGRFLSPKADKRILSPIVEVKLSKTNYAWVVNMERTLIKANFRLGIWRMSFPWFHRVNTAKLIYISVVVLFLNRQLVYHKLLHPEYNITTTCSSSRLPISFRPVMPLERETKSVVWEKHCGLLANATELSGQWRLCARHKKEHNICRIPASGTAFCQACKTYSKPFVTSSFICLFAAEWRGYLSRNIRNR